VIHGNLRGEATGCEEGERDREEEAEEFHGDFDVWETQPALWDVEF
jgi:hypothetical protein